MEITSFIFHGKLNSRDKQSEQNEIKRELKSIAQQIYTSLPGTWEINIWLASEKLYNWEEAGNHKLSLIGYEDDKHPWLQSLVLSWKTMLEASMMKEALAISINRPGNFKKESFVTFQEKTSSIANPEELTLKGEWLPENPRFTKKQWIVSKCIMQSFEDAVSIIRNRKKIYQDWGFEEVDPNPRAVICFYGPAGTGKTMAAHVLASELNSKIIAVKYSQIESKYVGDAPKNLKRVFEDAKTANAVLFFDEADSFLGKRIENVSNGSEQAINSLRGEMLILLEEFQGVVVFASNLLTNIDRAFESRIVSKIEFEMPNAEARRAIIRSKIPTKVPLEKELGEKEMDKLVEISDGFSGRIIRTSVLMSFVKAARNAEITGEDIVRFTDFVEAFHEQKEIAEKIDMQYKGASEISEMTIPESAHKPLLDVSAEVLCKTECKQNKIK